MHFKLCLELSINWRRSLAAWPSGLELVLATTCTFGSTLTQTPSCCALGWSTIRHYLCLLASNMQKIKRNTRWYKSRGTSEMATPKRVRISGPKNSDTTRLLLNRGITWTFKWKSALYKGIPIAVRRSLTFLHNEKLSCLVKYRLSTSSLRR